MFCSPQPISQIQLQQLFTGKESIVFKSLPAVDVLYFTASEKDNLRTESYSYKEQKLSQCTGKQNYVMKNEKNSDYYYLSNREMILTKLAGLLFPRKFNKRTSLFTPTRYIKQQYGSLTGDKDKAGSAKVINLGM